MKRFSSIEELDVVHNLKPLSKNDEENIEKMLDKEVDVFFNSTNQVLTEADIYIADLIEIN